MQQTWWIQKKEGLVSVFWIDQLERCKLAVHEVLELALVTIATTFSWVQPSQIPHEAVVGGPHLLVAVVSPQLAMLLSIEDTEAEGVGTIVSGGGVVANADT